MLLVQLTQSNMRVEYERRFPAYLVPHEPVDHEQAYSGELERFIHDGRTIQDLLRKIEGRLDHDGTEEVVSVADQSNDKQAWETGGELLKLMPVTSRTVLDLQRDQATSSYSLLVAGLDAIRKNASSAHHNIRTQINQQLQ